MEPSQTASPFWKRWTWTRWVERVGPYLLLEILMPGGTLLCLLLYLYQRKGMGSDATEVSAVVAAFDALRNAYRRLAPSWLQL